MPPNVSLLCYTVAMKQLWAPWRMAYIGADKQEAGCIFCIKPQQNADAENYILYRGPQTFVMMNLFPYNNGHLMVAPYRHVGSIEELTPDVLQEILTTAQLCLRALRRAMHPDGFNMGINQGKVAGAGIADHVHFHIVPRWDGDTNFMPVLGDVKVMPDYLSNTYNQLREQIVVLTQGQGQAGG